MAGATLAASKPPRVARGGYNDRIVIRRDRNGWEVELEDPELVAYNQTRGDDDPYCDSTVEYNFETKEQVLAFLTAVLDKALPEDDFGSTFDKLAKEAMKP